MRTVGYFSLQKKIGQGSLTMSRAKHHVWTIDQIDILINNYPDSTPEQMESVFSGMLNRRQIGNKAKKLGLHKSESYKFEHGIGKNGRIIKGHLSWNKGLKGFNPDGENRETQFKAGSIPPNHTPVGTTRIDSDGYIYIKVEEGLNKYKLLHREIWKKHYGEYPAKGMAIIFKDGNKQNCNIDNLELVTRKQLMQRNSVHNLPKEIADLIALKGSLTRRINGNYPTKKRHNGTENPTV